MAEGNQHETECNGGGKASLDVTAAITAIRHPMRREIIQMCDGRETSPSELATEICQPLSNVSYHVRVLVSCGVLELVRTEQVRGTTQHFYVSRASENGQLQNILLAVAPSDEWPQAAS
jgi:predicted transcriptional regulator